MFDWMGQGEVSFIYYNSKKRGILHNFLFFSKIFSKCPLLGKKQQMLRGQRHLLSVNQSL